MKINNIKETCLYIIDLLTAYNFYHEKLGFPVISYVEGKHVFFRAGSSVLLVFNPEDSKHKTHPPGHHARGVQHIAFEVSREDYDETKKKIQESGIKIVDTVIWQTGQESFYFYDPSGHLLEIVPEGIWGN